MSSRPIPQAEGSRAEHRPGARLVAASSPFACGRIFLAPVISLAAALFVVASGSLPAAGEEASPDPESWRAAFQVFASTLPLNESLKAVDLGKARLRVARELDLPRVTLGLARRDPQRLEAMVRALLTLPEGELLRQTRADGSVLIEADLHRRRYLDRLRSEELLPLRRAILAAVATGRGASMAGPDGKPLFGGDASAPGVLARLDIQSIDELLSGIPQIVGNAAGNGDITVLALATWPDGIREPTISASYFRASGSGRSGIGSLIRPANQMVMRSDSQLRGPGAAINLDALLQMGRTGSDDVPDFELRLPPADRRGTEGTESEAYVAISAAELLARVASASGHDLLAATPLQAPLFYKSTKETSRLSLKVLLTRLAALYAWRWSILPGERPAIVVTPLRSWKVNETEPTDNQVAWALQRLREKPANEPPTMDDLAFLVSAERAQIQRLIEAHILPWTAGLINDQFSDGREVLPLARFFLALPPDQRRRALSPLGLPIRDASITTVKQHLRLNIRQQLAMPTVEEGLDAVFSVTDFDSNSQVGWRMMLLHPLARNRVSFGFLTASMRGDSAAKQVDRGLSVDVMSWKDRKVIGLGNQPFHRRDVEWLERRGQPAGKAQP